MKKFLFDCEAWLSSGQIDAMTAEQERGYLRLLIHAWMQEDCGLPDDDKKLAVWSRMGSKWRTAGEAVKACFFKADNGRLYNQRLLKEREYQQKFNEQRKEAARSRWEKKPRAREPEAQKSDATAYATASPPHMRPHMRAHDSRIDLAYPLAYATESESESEIENPIGEREAQEHPRGPDHGRGPSPPPIPKPKSAEPSPPSPSRAPALPTPRQAPSAQTAPSPPIRVETRQAGPNGMHRPSRIEIPPGLPPEHVELARTLREVTDGRMSPDVPDADLVRFLLAEAEAAGMPPADLRALVVTCVRRQRRSNSRWRPESWGWFRMVLPSRMRGAATEARAG